MINILGTIRDSAGNPLDGRLVVTLNGAMTDDLAIPTDLFLPLRFEFTITAGVVDIDLEESETKKTSYKFEFYTPDPDEPLLELQLSPFPFNAVVPTLSPTVNLTELIPTGIVTDTLATGALRVARIISADPNLASTIGGVFPRGVWSALITDYRRGDIVSYLDRTYIANSQVPTGEEPTNDIYWQLLPLETTGTVTLGDDTPYGLSWNASGLAPSQNSIYDKIETLAPSASPSFTGTPIAPTAISSNNSNQLATTAFVQDQKISPVFTGTPTAPTAPIGTNTTQLATTAFVQNALIAKNVLINGNFVIDQRNAGASQTIVAGAAKAYTVDCWYAYCTGANVTGQRIAGSLQSPYRYQFTGAASNTAIQFGQRIESDYSYHLNGQTCTLSVDLSSNAITTVTWTAYYANTKDNFGTIASPTRTLISTGTFTINNTINRYSTQISIPSAATTGIEIVFSVGALLGSQTWTIGNAQLEKGSVETDFEDRYDLDKCLRRLEVQIFGTSPVGSTNSALNVVTRVAGEVTGGYLTYTQKATIPIINITNNGNLRYASSSGIYASVSLSAANSTRTSSYLFFDTLPVSSFGWIDQIGNIIISCEL